MFCHQCGTQVEEGTAFCPKCGTQIKKEADTEKGAAAVKQKEEKKKPQKPVLKIVGIVVSILAVVLLWKAFKGDFDKAASEATNGAYGKGDIGTEQKDDDIVMVQTGYLGEFEDATVKDILDMNFGLSGYSLDWISTDLNGEKVIGFCCHLEGESLDSEGSTEILFQVCPNHTFKIVGYAVGGNEDFERTEIAADLNTYYMNWYVKNKIGQDAEEDEIMAGMQDLIHNQLDKISGSAVLYGASKDYSGDRKNLSIDIDGTEPLNMSVTELINLYSDNMLDIYTARENDVDGIEANEQPAYQDAQDIDYDTVYGDILLDVIASYGEYSQCALYDMDGDGILELITSFGESDADWVNDFYTVENGAVTMLGEYSGAVTFYGADDGKGIVAVYDHMGYQIVERITKSGSSILVDEMMQGEVENDEYYSNEYPISLMHIHEVL